MSIFIFHQNMKKSCYVVFYLLNFFTVHNQIHFFFFLESLLSEKIVFVACLSPICLSLCLSFTVTCLNFCLLVSGGLVTKFLFSLINAFSFKFSLFLTRVGHVTTFLNSDLFRQFLVPILFNYLTLKKQSVSETEFLVLYVQQPVPNFYDVPSQVSLM